MAGFLFAHLFEKGFIVVANYHRDSLRHWSCTCSADDAFRLRQKIASSGIELPEVDIVWTITDGEQNPQSVHLAAWEHVVDVLGAAIRGDFNTTAEAIDATKMDFADVLKCFDVRAAAEWEPLIVAAETEIASSQLPESVPEPPVAISDLPAPEPTPEPPQPEVSSGPVSPTDEPAVESESVPVSEVKEGENLDS